MELSVEELIPFGYAPGSYWGRKCFSCEEKMSNVDKRASRRLPCAVIAYHEHERTIKAKNTHTWED